MITYEQKLAHMTDVVMSSFSEILEPVGVYAALRLFWLENRKLKLRGTIEQFIEMLNIGQFDGITNESALMLLRTIKECGLINAKKSDDGMIVVSTNMVNKPDFEQKMAILESLNTKGLLTAGQYGEVKQELIANNEKRKIKEETVESVQETKTSNDIDFSKPKPPRKVNPDSAPELVKFYYRLMHDVFGGKYESPNFLKEAHQLKLEMQKHGDSAEDTRKFFAFILNGAKEKGAFDKVSSLSLYSRLRPTAYQKIIVEKNAKYDKFIKYEDVKKSDDDIMTSMKEIYDLYVKSGTQRDDIKIQLIDAFTPELVEEFFKGLPND
jgi:hypothetical protein